jgi:hypothetical protein
MPLARMPDVTKNTTDHHVGKRALRIVFVPWDRTEGEEWAIKSEQWNHVTGNKFEIVFYEPGQKSYWLKKVSCEPAGVIYIRGHGNPGVPYIQVKVDTGAAAVVERKLLITEACDRLIQSGLEKSYPGVIKFFHCHSATVLAPDAYAEEIAKANSNNQTVAEGFAEGKLSQQQKDKFWKEIYPNKSIARNGADYMRKQGYKSCLYYGYLGPLASAYDTDAEEGKATGTLFHKKVEIAGLQNRPNHLLGVVTTRASQGRVQV